MHGIGHNSRKARVRKPYDQLTIFGKRNHTMDALKSTPEGSNTLSFRANAVLLCILNMMTDGRVRKMHDGTDAIAVSQETIADKMNTSPSTVERAIAELKKTGVLVVETHRGDNDRSNLYAPGTIPWLERDADGYYLWAKDRQTVNMTDNSDQSNPSLSGSNPSFSGSNPSNRGEQTVNMTEHKDISKDTTRKTYNKERETGVSDKEEEAEDSRSTVRPCPNQQGNVHDLTPEQIEERERMKRDIERDRRDNIPATHDADF